MALLLPMLVLLLLGIIMTGFTLYAFIQVSNAAREGARAGSTYRLTRIASPGLDQTVRSAIYDPNDPPGCTINCKSALGFLAPTGSSFNVASGDVAWSLVTPLGAPGDTTDPAPRDQLTVTVTYRYTIPLISDMLPMFPQPIVIVRQVMMEVQ